MTFPDVLGVGLMLRVRVSAVKRTVKVFKVDTNSYILEHNWNYALKSQCVPPHRYHMLVFFLLLKKNNKKIHRNNGILNHFLFLMCVLIIFYVHMGMGCLKISFVSVLIGIFTPGHLEKIKYFSLFQMTGASRSWYSYHVKITREHFLPCENSQGIF